MRRLLVRKERRSVGRPRVFNEKLANVSIKIPERIWKGFRKASIDMGISSGKLLANLMEDYLEKIADA